MVLECENEGGAVVAGSTEVEDGRRLAVIGTVSLSAGRHSLDSSISWKIQGGQRTEPCWVINQSHRRGVRAKGWKRGMESRLYSEGTESGIFNKFPLALVDL